MADEAALPPQPGLQPDAKRRRQEPLTEEQMQAAQEMLLRGDLSFKLKQASGPVHPRAVKARARRALWSSVHCSHVRLSVQKLKHLIQAEEYHLAPPSEPTCALGALESSATRGVCGM